MRISRAGILILISLSVLIGTNCAYYNRIITRKNLVDGAKAYKDKKFKEAEALFRNAVDRDPEGKTEEGRTAQLFLARTIHSQYAGNRSVTFGESDFLGENRLGLAEKLKAEKDPLSQWLHGQLSAETRQVYEEYLSLNPSSSDMEGNKKKGDAQKKFLSGLAIDLNKVLEGPSIYDEARFSKVKLSEFTKNFMAKNPTGEDLKRLNRLLLEDAYPDDISKKPKAEDAIEAYKKVLDKKIDDNGSFKAVANLYENLGKNDEWLAWVTDRTNNTAVPPEQRAEALTSLAARKYSCANEISDTPAVKTETDRGGERVYAFKKPEKPEDFDKLKQCTDEGLALIDKALELNKQAGVESDSTWSYKANLLVQKMRVADMEGRAADRDALKKEAQSAKDKFTVLAAETKKKKDEEEARKKAEAEAVNK